MSKFTYNGNRLPLIGETIWLIGHIRKTNKAGHKFFRRKATELELIEAKVNEIKVGSEFLNHSAPNIITWLGKASAVEPPYVQYDFMEGSFAYSKEYGETLLQHFRTKGFIPWHNGRIQYLDKSFAPLVPLGLIWNDDELPARGYSLGYGLAICFQRNSVGYFEYTLFLNGKLQKEGVIGCPFTTGADALSQAINLCGIHILELTPLSDQDVEELMGQKHIGVEAYER